jgi:hypothetical protein
MQLCIISRLYSAREINTKSVMLLLLIFIVIYWVIPRALPQEFLKQNFKMNYETRKEGDFKATFCCKLHYT